MELEEPPAAEPVVLVGALRSGGTSPTDSSLGTSADPDETSTLLAALGLSSVPAVAFPMPKATMNATAMLASATSRCKPLNDNYAA